MDVKAATVYSKSWSVTKPDFYERESNCWIVFPWERKETVRTMVKKYVMKGTSFEKEKAKLIEAGMPSKLLDRFLREITEEENC